MRHVELVNHVLGYEHSDSVDLMYLDWTATEEQLAAMATLRADGCIRHVGVLRTMDTLGDREMQALERGQGSRIPNPHRSAAESARGWRCFPSAW